MAVNGLYCADVLLSNCSRTTLCAFDLLTHSAI